MTVIERMQERLGASFETVGGRAVAREYGRPDRTHVAVRSGVGVTEMPYGVVTVSGDDRVSFVDNAVSNRVPTEDGRGVYSLLLDPQGGIETDMYVYNAGSQLLVFTPPGEAGSLAAGWREKTFIQDVEIAAASESFGVFGVHGPKATEKIASVLNGAGAPDERLSFVRGRMDDVGVTVIRTDAPTGEESYEVVCTTEDSETVFEQSRSNPHAVFDTLLNHGLNAVPFGTRTWESLTLEAGTPLFETELAGEIPNVLGLRNAVDFEKGCFVGQEVVSRVENRGRPSKRLVGLRPEAVPERGAAVFAGDAAVGEVTRAVESPSLREPVALALVAFEAGAGDEKLTVRVDGDERTAARAELPLVEGSDRSARLPSY